MSSSGNLGFISRNLHVKHLYFIREATFWWKYSTTPY